MITAFALTTIAVIISDFIFADKVSQRPDRKVAIATNELGRLFGVTREGRFRYLFAGRAGAPGKASAQGDE
jgi:hypothetical protein